MKFRPCLPFMAMAALFCAFPVKAQSFSFATPGKEAEKFFINQYFSDNSSERKMARLDLNGDGIDEYIVKSGPCDANGACSYTVLADAGHKPVLLGEIRAIRVKPGQGYSYGVRNLEAYQNPDNDFVSNIYAWDSTASRYKILK